MPICSKLYGTTLLSRRAHSDPAPDLSWLIWLFVLAQFFVPLYQKQMREPAPPSVEFIPLPYNAPPRSVRPSGERSSSD